MFFNVDIDKLIELGVSIEEYLLCQFAYKGESTKFNQYMDKFSGSFSKAMVDGLINKGFLYLEDDKKGYRISNIKVQELFIDKFDLNKESFVEEMINKSKKSSSKIIDWFDEWYALWPSIMGSGGYRIKGDRRGCIRRLEKFTKDYPEYNKDIIMKATKEYVDRCKANRYRYMQLAHYFIYKNNISSLASYCEAIVDKVKDGKYDLDDNYEYDNINDI